MRVVLGVSYQGAAYCGWQIQPVVPTVQARLQAALKSFALVDISTICAGRTDTGVHARAQVVHFDTQVMRDEASWVRGVNAFLPADIRVQWSRCLPEPGDEQTSFHARFHARNSAVRRRYRYVLYESPVASAIGHTLAGWVFTPLDEQAMRRAAAQWIGEHDFSAFRSSECQALSPLKIMHEISIEKHGPWWVFGFEGSAFLHHMVRNMMGTLVAIGCGKRDANWAAELLASRDRKLGEPTFMAAGLYLDGVKYPEQFQLDELTWRSNTYLV
jgi:tRNA pseudouridine38-40 synthase